MARSADERPQSFFQNRPDLLAGLRAGRRDVLEALYWTYVHRVEHIVRSGFRVRGTGWASTGVPRSEVADLVQEAFAKAFRESARMAYDGCRDYGVFLDAITRNVVIDWARRREPLKLELSAEVCEPVARDGEELHREQVLLGLVDDYIAGLPEEIRRVHEQRFIHGRSQLHAASLLGLTRQQLRTLENKLRAGLARALRRAGHATETPSAARSKGEATAREYSEPSRPLKNGAC